jgi:endonuclease YncB( thermonuclease family)
MSLVVTTLIAVAAVVTVLVLLRRGQPVPDTSSVLVTRVIDGDTFDAIGSDDPQRRLQIRIVGIDAPERARDGRPADCMADQAAVRLAQVIDGRLVTLTADRTQPARDRFGRYLAYVDTDTGRDIGRLLIREGLARVYHPARQPGPIRTVDYRKTEQVARAEGLGIWGCR